MELSIFFYYKYCLKLYNHAVWSLLPFIFFWTTKKFSKNQLLPLLVEDDLQLFNTLDDWEIFCQIVSAFFGTSATWHDLKYKLCSFTLWRPLALDARDSCPAQPPVWTPLIERKVCVLSIAFYDEWRIAVRTVACRGLVMPGGYAWLDAPFPNSSIEQWRIVVIVIGYTLFVTSQYDFIFTFANQCFGEVCWYNMHIQGRRSSKRVRTMETYKKQ